VGVGAKQSIRICNCRRGCPTKICFPLFLHYGARQFWWGFRGLPHFENIANTEAFIKETPVYPWYPIWSTCQRHIRQRRHV